MRERTTRMFAVKGDLFVIFCLSLLILRIQWTTAFKSQLARCTNARLCSSVSLSMVSRTYSSVHLQSDRGRLSLLVDDCERKVHSTLLSWARDGSASSKEHTEMLQQWMKEGKVFGLSPRGVKVLNAHEQSAHRKRLTEYARNARKRPFRFSFSDTNVFSNLGTERNPMFVKVGSASARRGGDGAKEIFSNLTELFQAETRYHLLRRVSVEIGLNPNSNFARKWADTFEEFNITSSLSTVIALYANRYSKSEDGTGSSYFRRPGYVGTLAPGAAYPEHHALDTLPKRILHPWPAFQEIPFHGRNPPGHPAILPTPVLFGLNGRLKESQVARALSRPPQPYYEFVNGGIEFRSAVWFLNNVTIGRCYEESEQIPHGGAVHDGHGIFGYTPDHGPIANNTKFYIEEINAWKENPFQELSPDSTLPVFTPPKLGIQDKRERKIEENIRKGRFEYALAKFYPAVHQEYVTDRQQEKEWIDETINPKMELVEEYYSKIEQAADANFEKQRQIALQHVGPNDPLRAQIEQFGGLTYEQRAQLADSMVASEVSEQAKKLPRGGDDVNWDQLKIPPVNVESLPSLDSDTFHDENANLGVGLIRVKRTNEAMPRFTKHEVDQVREHRAFLEEAYHRSYVQEVRRKRSKWRNPNRVFEYAITRSADMFEEEQRESNLNYKEMLRIKTGHKRSTLTGSFKRTQASTGNEFSME